MAEIYYPIEKSGLQSVIPGTDQILYCTMCEANFHRSKATGTGLRTFKKKWQTPVILTNEGVAYIERVAYQRTDFDVREIAGTPQYVPWYYVKWVARGRLQIRDTEFKLIRTPELESEEDFSKRFHAFGGKFRHLMKEVKEQAGVANRGLKIFLSGLGIGFIVYFTTLLLFGYPILNVLNLTNIIKYGDYLFTFIFSMGVSYLVMWIIISRRSYKKIKKYEEAKNLPQTF